MAIPNRVHNLSLARERHGDLIDRLIPWLSVGDELADAVCDQLEGRYGAFERALRSGLGPDTPSSVADLLRAHDNVPAWVDEDRVARGGRLFFRSAQRVDYAVLMGYLMIAAALIILFNIVADIVYAFLDPRIRYD